MQFIMFFVSVLFAYGFGRLTGKAEAREDIREEVAKQIRRRKHEAECLGGWPTKKGTN